MQIRRMADASLALAERRAGDLKDAVERLGQAPPAGASCSPCAPWASWFRDERGDHRPYEGVLLIILLIVVLLAIGTGIVELISLPFGGLGIAPSVLLGCSWSSPRSASPQRLGGAGAIAPAPLQAEPARAGELLIPGLGLPCVCTCLPDRNPAAGGGKPGALHPVSRAPCAAMA